MSQLKLSKSRRIEQLEDRITALEREVANIIRIINVGDHSVVLSQERFKELEATVKLLLLASSKGVAA